MPRLPNGAIQPVKSVAPVQPPRPARVGQQPIVAPTPAAPRRSPNRALQKPITPVAPLNADGTPKGSRPSNVSTGLFGAVDRAAQDGANDIPGALPPAPAASTSSLPGGVQPWSETPWQPPPAYTGPSKPPPTPEIYKEDKYTEGPAYAGSSIPAYSHKAWNEDPYKEDYSYNEDPSKAYGLGATSAANLDPIDLANKIGDAQDLRNKETAKMDAAYNSVGTEDPYGKSEYVIDANGNRTLKTTLSAKEEDIKNKEEDFAGGLYGKIGSAVSGVPDSPFSFDGEAERKRIEDTLYKKTADRMEPQFSRELEQFDQDMANKGVPEGSKLYNQLKSQLVQSQNDARADAHARAVEMGGTELSRSFGISKDTYKMPTETLQALYGMSRGAKGPQTFGPSKVDVGNVDVTNPAITGYSLKEGSEENAKGREFGAGQNAAGRNFTAGESKAARNADAYQARQGRLYGDNNAINNEGFTSTESERDKAYESGENGKNRVFNAEEASKNRYFQDLTHRNDLSNADYQSDEGRRFSSGENRAGLLGAAYENSTGRSFSDLQARNGMLGDISNREDTQNFTARENARERQATKANLQAQIAAQERLARMKGSGGGGGGGGYDPVALANLKAQLADIDALNAADEKKKSQPKKRNGLIDALGGLAVGAGRTAIDATIRKSIGES